MSVVNFSNPWIACCEFEGLETAVEVGRFSRPLITRSAFRDNRRALAVSQKPNHPVRGNVFSGNDEAIFIDLSAYPEIRGNNFTGNGKDVVLGIYMSADWEKRVGSGGISRMRAAESRSRNLWGVKRPLEFTGKVDARENWWGPERTAEMGSLGPEGNASGIDDRHDRPEVSYPGFGEGSYRLDVVVYSPWRKGRVEEAGPAPGGCADLYPPSPGGGEAPGGPGGMGPAAGQPGRPGE